jgi:hypothetical protein
MTPATLTRLLQEHFSLEVEGMADALHHSHYYHAWFSAYETDKVFGAKHDFFKQSLEGRNTYINPPFNTYMNDEHVITQVIRKVANELRSDRPTRVVLLIPIFEGPTGNLYETQAREARFLEIVSFDKNSFPFVAPEHFSIREDFRPGFFAGKVVLFLAVNRASLKIDPINWEVMSADILQWSTSYCRTPATICQATRNKFLERKELDYSARAFTKHNDVIYQPSSGMYHYFDYTIESANESRNMRKYVYEKSHLKLLSDVNRHDRLAGVVGILPNALIKLIKATKYAEREEIMNDLRLTAFWSGYLIWMRRHKLCQQYWRKKIPEQWKTPPAEKKSGNTTKRKRKSKRMRLEACKNAFHYLELKDPKRVPSLGTCNCLATSRKSEDKSNNKIAQPQKKQKTKQQHAAIDGLDHKHQTKIVTVSGKLTIAKHHMSKRSGDVIREEHDRKKRYKKEASC